jgi:hypothetical protein
MTLTGPGGITSSVAIQTWTLWYGGNFFVLLKFYTVSYIHRPVCEIYLFQPYTFREWIDIE